MKPDERFQGEQAGAYERRIRRLIPGYELLHQLTAAQLAARLSEQARILLLGVGTGQELRLLAAAHPHWHFTATDISADMLAQARAHAESAGYAERVHWHLGPLETLTTDAPHDAALALLVLHFVPDDGQKQALLVQLRHQLRPQGWLLWADIQAAADAYERDAHRRTSIVLGLDADTATQMLERMQRDFHPIADERRDALLRESGYGPAIPYFRALGISALVTPAQIK